MALDLAARLSYVAPNPKKVNSGAWTRYQHYEVGISLQEFIDRGGTKADISWDLKQGFIRTGDDHTIEAPPVPPTPRIEKQLIRGNLPVQAAHFKMRTVRQTEQSYIEATTEDGQKWVCIQDYLSEGLAELAVESALANGINPKWWRKK